MKLPLGHNAAGKGLRGGAFRSFFSVFLLVMLADLTRAELLPVKTYLSTEGLIYEKVERIYQDSRGFVWITTPVGVSRFDGYRFVSYGMEDGLPHTLLTDMAEDDNGIYWFGTQWGGVYRFDPRAVAEGGKQSQPKPKFEKLSVEPTNSYVFRLCKTRRGEIFVGTNAGLFLLDDRKENKFSRVELNLPPVEVLSVTAIAEDTDGSLWIGHRFGLTRRLPSGAMIHYEVQPTGETDLIRSLSIDVHNRVWIITDQRGVIVFNPESANSFDASNTTRRKLRFKPENKLVAGLPQGFAYQFTPEESLGDGSFRFVQATADGKVWFAAYDKGLVEFDGGKFHLYTKRNGLSDNTITALTEDCFGNLWIGSEWGVMKLSRRGFLTYNREDGLANEQVRNVFLDCAGALHVFNSGWVFNRFDGKKFIPVKLNLPEEASRWRPMRVVSDCHGEWWFGTASGLYRYAAVNDLRQLATAKPLAIYTRRDGLAGDSIFSVFEDSRGDVWASFQDQAGSVTRWRRATGEFETFTKEHGFPENCLTVYFREDGGGNLVMACDAAIVLYRDRDKGFITFQSEEYLPKGWWVSDMQVDRKGRIWVAVPVKGLVRIENLASGHPVARL